MPPNPYDNTEPKKRISLRVPVRILVAMEASYRRKGTLKFMTLTDMVTETLEKAMSVELDILKGWEKLNAMPYKEQLEELRKMVPVEDFVKANFPKPVPAMDICEAIKLHCEEEISNFFINQS